MFTVGGLLFVWVGLTDRGLSLGGVDWGRSPKATPPRDSGLPYYINVMQNKKNNSELIHFIDGMGSGTTSKLRYVTTFAGDNATFTLVRIWPL